MNEQNDSVIKRIFKKENAGKLCAATVAAAGIGYVVATEVAAYFVYYFTFNRGSGKRWSRDHDDSSPLKQSMYDRGRAWRAEHLDKMSEVSIVSEGLRMFGEYYDFGFDKCVVVLLGRSEAFPSAFNFVEPYIQKGFNVLAIDSRGHGKSEGEFHTFGFEESKDYVNWAKFLISEKGIKHIVFHGICVGAAGGLYALLSDECPDCVDALVAEGMHTRLYETVKNHVIHAKMPTFMIMETIDYWLKKKTGHTMMYGPVDVIDRYRKPLLMLQSSADDFSLPDLSREMFDKCPSELKRFVLFDGGKHSVLSVTHTEKYYNEIKSFIDELYPEDV